MNRSAHRFDAAASAWIESQQTQHRSPNSLSTYLCALANAPGAGRDQRRFTAGRAGPGHDGGAVWGRPAATRAGRTYPDFNRPRWRDGPGFRQGPGTDRPLDQGSRPDGQTLP